MRRVHENDSERIGITPLGRVSALLRGIALLKQQDLTYSSDSSSSDSAFLSPRRASPRETALFELPPGCVHHFFISHKQATGAFCRPGAAHLPPQPLYPPHAHASESVAGQVQAKTLALLLNRLGASVWYDMLAEEIDITAMSSSAVFLLFLSPGVLDSKYCRSGSLGRWRMPLPPHILRRVARNCHRMPFQSQHAEPPIGCVQDGDRMGGRCP